MRNRRDLSLVILIGLFILAPLSDGWSWDITPKATELDKMIKEFRSIRFWSFWGGEITDFIVDRFSNPVHEAITHRIYGCDHDFKFCSSPPSPYQFASDALIAGVRWNDNPRFELIESTSGTQKDCVGIPIYLPDQAICWAKLFYDANKGAKKGKVYDGDSGHALLYRVHFGDMQFLHSMASRDGEPAKETKAKIMAWAEFAYKVARREIKHNDYLYKCGIPEIENLFSRKRGWTVQMLFTWDDPTYQPRRVKGELHDEPFLDLAFGTLLHMVEDSFSKSHVTRNPPGGNYCQRIPPYGQPGKIISFHSFAKQKTRKHGKEDNQEAFMNNLLRYPSLNVVEVGKVIRNYRENNEPWDKLRDYLECVFDLEDPDAKAGPGEQFAAD
ncbi:MAG: hypothetical protein FJ123_18075 [Deltaproteobacteria bacterium]|nr:hypothetical protein [Deltaproteobacteria bacterium]